MAETTAISWADATFNPWEGCTRISAACDNCYAAARAERFGNGHLWAGELRRTSTAYWRKPLKWNREAAAERKPRRVFCASLADVFDNQAPQAWRDDLWALIEATPWLTWMLLTKRPQKIVGMVPPRWLIEPPRNVWYGATIEHREALRQRLHHLRAVPAALRFISAEPLLESIAGTSMALALGDLSDGALDLVHLVIAGGESGRKARPSHPDWFRELRDLCAAMGAVFHFKQWGEWAPHPSGEPVTIQQYHAQIRYIDQATGEQKRDCPKWPDATMRRIGTARAGRALDGVIHDAMPDMRQYYFGSGDCRACGVDLAAPSATGGAEGLCGPCYEELPF